MTTWLNAGPVPPVGEATDVRVAGRVFAVANVDGVVYALDGICPHNGGPLGHGGLHGHLLCCPWHAWEFDCRTGEDPLNPAVRVAVYPARIQDGEVFIQVE